MQTAYDKGRLQMAQRIIRDAMEWGDFEPGVRARDSVDLINIAICVFRKLDPIDTEPLGRWLWQCVRVDLAGFLLQVKEWLDIAVYEEILTDDWFLERGFAANNDWPGCIEDFRDNFQAILEAAVISAHERAAA